MDLHDSRKTAFQIQVEPCKEKKNKTKTKKKKKINF